jgi:hypothetical protein
MTDKEMALGSAVERMHMSGDDNWPDQWEIAVCELAEELGIDDNVAELMLSLEMDVNADFLLDWFESETVLHETCFC